MKLIALLFLFVLALLCALYLIIPKPSQDFQRRAMETHLLGWVRHRLHENWINGTAFLPDGIHNWGTTYPFQFIVTSKTTEMEQVPALTATVQYDDLNKGLVIVNLDSGKAHEFDKEINQFKEFELSPAIDRSSWETVYLYMYSPNP